MSRSLGLILVALLGIGAGWLGHDLYLRANPSQVVNYVVPALLSARQGAYQAQLAAYAKNVVTAIAAREALGYPANAECLHGYDAGDGVFVEAPIGLTHCSIAEPKDGRGRLLIKVGRADGISAEQVYW